MAKDDTSSDAPAGAKAAAAGFAGFFFALLAAVILYGMLGA